ncbi:uncharacterized protein LOC115740933 [Rhodamnia argentea]|uniref:Uncharacterized protein LOC115740933 n=1 Tax=Rhodamnia argentea TaxID=178133 RepID=A0ABM3HBR3_9MYRT|nr:uncharacterized protein LOC115740933 [Rhodamnia argentea]
MGSSQMPVLCVKRVKQEVPEDWDESMPLPGDIIEGFAQDDMDEFVPTKARSEFVLQLGKISQQAEIFWVRVRRGDRVIKLRARIAPLKGSMLQRKLTIKAATDDRHVVVLGDLSLEQCTELQEMSRRVVNVDAGGFKKKGVRYDWKTKVGTYLPDQRSPVVCSVLFMPLPGEHTIEATTTRSMAWFSAAVSSGIPLIFVNIQTEQIVTSGKNIPTGKEISLGKQHNQTMTVQMVHGIRLWFLPGIAEVSVELVAEPEETRFGMDIKRTEEGFICIFSVTKGSAADRAGLGCIHEEANAAGHLLAVSRLEGKSLLPSNVCSEGLIHCCERGDIREVLTAAIDTMDRIKIHIMGWPNQTRPNASPPMGAAFLRPPNVHCSTPPLLKK